MRHHYRLATMNAQLAEDRGIVLLGHMKHNDRSLGSFEYLTVVEIFIVCHILSLCLTGQLCELYKFSTLCRNYHTMGVFMCCVNTLAKYSNLTRWHSL